MNNHVTCFLPCRSGSERVSRKNLRPFAGFEHGLIEVKLKQLCDSERIEKIVLSTNDDEILSYADGIDQHKVVLHRRVESLSASSTSTDLLVPHVLDLIPEGHILWTHVTSPFLNAKYYDQIIDVYFSCLSKGYDSLMTTTLIHGFLWSKEAPINYNRLEEKWPRTQTLDPVHEVNSGAFLAHANIYRDCFDRIGNNPHLYPLEKLVSFDIDWPEDFLLAESIVDRNLAIL